MNVTEATFGGVAFAIVFASSFLVVELQGLWEAMVYTMVVGTVMFIIVVRLYRKATGRSGPTEQHGRG